jgi:holo-[acyl-carrier protein] synthase
MVIVTGIDLIEIERVEAASQRWGERFLRRVFTAEELALYAGRPASLAARWAAKEAVAKALGIGVRGLGASPAAVGWHEIEIIKGQAGEPLLTLHGSAAARAAAMGLTQFSLSLTHSGTMAAAVVVGVGA